MLVLRDMKHSPSGSGRCCLLRDARLLWREAPSMEDSGIFVLRSNVLQCAQVSARAMGHVYSVHRFVAFKLLMIRPFGRVFNRHTYFVCTYYVGRQGYSTCIFACGWPDAVLLTALLGRLVARPSLF